MKNPIKLLLIAGARPNFMKIAPIIHAIQAHNARCDGEVPHLEYKLVHTGQHYDAKMSDIFFEELGIPKPDVSLDVGSGSHATQTARVMERIEPVLLDYKPDWIVVVGDVNSTVACALVAAKLGIKVAHVEAGLRSFDRTMPEEINRVVTDAISDLLLTPSVDADETLRREGIPAEKIKLVGNVMIDSLVANLEKARQSTILEYNALQPGNFVYVTLHRPSNVDSEPSLRAIFQNLDTLADEMPVVLPIHPRTRKMLETFGLMPGPNSGIKMIEPVGYHDSLCLTENARLVLTDSGGLQEETTWFRTPCLTLRPNTERPITITKGSNKLTDTDALSDDLSGLLNGPSRRGEVPELWDGNAAERIIECFTGATAELRAPTSEIVQEV